MPIKRGPNFSDKLRIMEWRATGLDAEAIAARVLVEVGAVQRFIDFKEGAEQSPPAVEETLDDYEDVDDDDSSDDEY